jgi:arylsulfatase A-like enzyme
MMFLDKKIVIMKMLYLILPPLLLMACHPMDHNQATLRDKPNFIIIYADDMGYGDVGCFGATSIRTPNIDKMARNGMKLTEFYSASPVCSPSRAALLTGRYPVRMGIYGVFFPNSYYGMSPEELTLAEVLKTAGYKTGHIGKWHLGSRYKYLPLQQGFDEYFGIPYSNDMASVMYMRGNDIVEPVVDQHQTTRTYTEEAVDFIKRHQDRPFFLYLAHNMPHVPIYASRDFEGKSENGLYGDVIEEIDWSTGQILNTLESLGLDKKTLVIFSSDNGPWLVMRDHGGSAGNLREGKQYTFEGGMRVPTLAYWPDKIPGGSVYDDMGLMMDWMPTISNLAGAEIPDSIHIDGEDISDVLFESGTRDSKEFGYYNGNILRAYRYGDWKIKLPYEGFEGASWQKPVDGHDWLLFNLKNDPGENHNLADENPVKFNEIKQQLEAFTLKMGPLPESVMFRGQSNDNSHYKYLIETYGEEYWKID